MHGHPVGGVADDHQHPGRTDELERQFLAGGVARAFEDPRPEGRRSQSLGRGFDLLAGGLGVRPIDHARGAEVEGGIATPGICIDRNDLRAARTRELDRERADASAADHDHQLAVAQTGAEHRLPGGRGRIGEHRKLTQGHPGRAQRLRGGGALGHFTQAVRRHHHVGCEPSVAVVAGHELVSANAGLVGFASGAAAARKHRRDHHRASHERLGAGAAAGTDDEPRDLVAERQGQFASCGYPFGPEADVGVANATACDLHQYLTILQGRSRAYVAHQGGPWGGHHPTNDVHLSPAVGGRRSKERATRLIDGRRRIRSSLLETLRVNSHRFRGF